jgi:hypothetical protein
MSTLKVTNIQDTAGGNSSTSAEIYSGRAKAWVNFNGENLTIRASYNVNSITDISAGKQTVNLTTAMPDDDYAPVVSGQNASGGDPYTIGFGVVATGSIEVIRQRANGSLIDGSEYGLAIFR